MSLVRPTIILIGLIGLWQAIVSLSGAPPYILPSPLAVAQAWIARPDLFIRHGAITMAEILLGLMFGLILGIASALVMAYFRPARQWLLPVLVVSQAVPVFALAPILVLWVGYGMASKVVMATLIIYFPVTAAFHDGLRRTEPGWVELALTMNGSRWAILRHVRIPAALPALGSGLRVATAVAPIGAIVGEWVGSSSGLGYLMLHANARMQIDIMFAALATLALLAVALYFSVDFTVRRAIPWQPDS
ncbi:MAG: ABC transporter permease, partial [Rhodospirillales bacterium]|nr:ABC transporter permease [Rhodospirillales bacterium]